MLTEVRLFARVGEHVSAETACEGKPFSAYVTGMGLFLRVRQHVSFQIPSLSERLGANFANKCKLTVAG